MREIKFRAWSKEHNEMFSLSKPSKIGIIELNQHGEINTVGLFKYLSGDYAFVTLNVADVEISQYTGLKDKNGVEIYEGDIITHNNGTTSLFNHEEVRYWEGSFIAGSCTANNALVNFNASLYIEVIGNIYENPELLKDK